MRGVRDNMHTLETHAFGKGKRMLAFEWLVD